MHPPSQPAGPPTECGAGVALGRSPGAPDPARPKSRWRTLTLFTLLTFGFPTPAASVLSLDLLQRELPFAERAFYDAHVEAVESLDLATAAAIDRSATQFLDLQAAMPDDHVLQPDVQMNLAIALAAAGDVESALAFAQAALETKRASTGPYDLRLIPFMLAEGDVLTQADQTDAAIMAYQRAQNVTHRQLGVHTPAQLLAIERVIAVAALNDLDHIVDIQHKMSLRIAQQSMTPDVIATKQLALADHYNLRAEETPGGTFVSPDTAYIPLRLQRGQAAVSYYEDAITTLRSLDDPVRLTSAMHHLAQTWSMLDRPRSAKKAARLYLKEVRARFGDSSVRTGSALVSVGDIFLLSRDHRANEYYAEAWSVLEAAPDLRQELLGQPKRLKPREIRSYPMDRRPVHVGPDDPLIVRMIYTVRPDGRPGAVEILQANVLAEERRMSRAYLKRMLFRPRVVDGVPVATAEQEHVQPFWVGAPDALFPWNQKRLEEKRAREEAAAATATE
ncbi:MAG: hypothetical protein CMQ24_10575 [Gammaproteobacteria bacterium]|nr:hypothetical protein [Gammaproteobacteria bacterium]